MPNDVPKFSVECPCCKAELSVDPSTRSVIQHASAPVTDIAAEVAKLRTASAGRELAFQRSLAAERNREERLGRKFDELLRRAKESPDEKPLKDIDL